MSCFGHSGFFLKLSIYFPHHQPTLQHHSTYLHPSLPVPEVVRRRLGDLLGVAVQAVDILYTLV